MPSRLRQLFALTLLGGIVLLSGCSSQERPDPKDTIKGLFTAIRNSDSLYLTTNVDLARAAATLGEELSTDSAIMNRPDDLLSALTGEGQLRKRWLDDQIVLGQSTESGDTAWVEVSFIDRLTRVQYYNKMRLDFRDGRWVVSSFRTL
jgi:hypothetical protein